MPLARPRVVPCCADPPGPGGRWPLGGPRSRSLRGQARVAGHHLRPAVRRSAARLRGDPGPRRRHRADGGVDGRRGRPAHADHREDLVLEPFQAGALAQGRHLGEHPARAVGRGRLRRRRPAGARGAGRRRVPHRRTELLPHAAADQRDAAGAGGVHGAAAVISHALTAGLRPSLAEFTELAGRYTVVPVWRELLGDLETPVGAFRKLGGGHGSVLLESVEHGERWGRWSFIGTDPFATFRARAGRVTWSGTPPPGLPDGPPLAVLRAALQHLRSPSLPGLPPLFAGAVGYLGYDLVRELERLPDSTDDDLGLPDAVLVFPRSVVVFDHLGQKLVLVSNVVVDQAADLRAAYADGARRLDELAERLSVAAPAPVRPLPAAGPPAPAASAAPTRRRTRPSRRSCAPTRRNGPSTSCWSTWPATTSAGSAGPAPSRSATSCGWSATRTSCTWSPTWSGSSPTGWARSTCSPHPSPPGPCPARPRSGRWRSSTSSSATGAVPTPAASATSTSPATSTPASPSAPACSSATRPTARPAPGWWPIPCPSWRSARPRRRRACCSARSPPRRPSAAVADA